jgi:hypothetical protein
VEEYKKQFDKLVYQIRLYDPNMGGLMLVQRFILGLKEELRTTVEVQLPNTVAEAALFAATQEAVLDRAQKNVTKPYRKFQANTTKDDNSNTSTHFQKFEKGELWRAKQLKDYRKANGLCFKCGEKFVPGHQCIVVATAQVKAIDANEILSDDVLDALVAHGDDHDCHVSIHALAGSSKPGTIQFRALVGDQVMLLLLDSGSSHSFVDSALVNKLKCSVTTIPTLKVKVAGGAYMYCDTMVPNMQWWLQGHTFAHDMRVLSLGGYDGILGMDWLEQQGLMTCNWEDKWISFDQQDHPVKLQGLQSSALTSIQALSVEQLVKSYKGNDVWDVAELCLVENQLQISASVPEEIQSVLDDFAEVFQAPQGLPPHREFDHAVNLLPDSQPINCRPYRYSPLQKDEIEKQVKEMLLQGTVISSVSPFASPVLPVKKKDGS